MSEFDRAIDNAPRSFKASSYKFKPIKYETPTPVISKTAISTAEFVIPANIAVNFYKSSLKYNMQVMAEAKSTSVKVWSGFASHIDSVTLATNGDKRAVDQVDTGHFTKACWPVLASMDDFVSAPITTSAADENTAELTPGAPFHKTNQLASTAPAAAATTGKVLINDGTLATGDIHYTGIAQEYSGDLDAVNDNVATSDVWTSVNLPLRLLCPHSIFSMNKDWYFGEEMRLTIRFNRSDRYGFKGSAIATNAGAAALTLDAVLSTTTLKLWLAVVNSEDVKADLMNKIKGSGYDYLIPWVHRYKFPQTNQAGNKCEARKKITKAQGHNLLRVYNVPYHATDSVATVCNNSNKSSATAVGAKLTTVKSSLDGAWLQESDLNNADAEDFMYMRDMLQGCPVAQSYQTFNNHYVFIDNFSGKKSSEWLENDDVASGYSVGTKGTDEIEYIFEYTQVPAALNVYQFWVVQRILHIGPDGIYLK